MRNRRVHTAPYTRTRETLNHRGKPAQAETRPGGKSRPGPRRLSPRDEEEGSSQLLPPHQGARLPRRQPAHGVWGTVASPPAPQPSALAPTGPAAPQRQHLLGQVLATLGAQALHDDGVTTSF